MNADPPTPISREDLTRLGHDPRFRERMAALYAELDAEIAAHSPVCWNRGLCCNFGRTGHRLYVTALELAYFVRERDGGEGDQGGSTNEGQRDEEKNVNTSKSQNVKSESDAAFRTATVRERPTESQHAAPVDDAATCPYQVDGLCTVRDIRPMGCRVYFCQASSRWWQGPMTESWLARLKALHEEFEVPYAYVEWLAGLRAVQAD